MTRTMMRMKSVNTTEMEMAASTFCLSFGVEPLVSNPVYIDCINIKIIMDPEFCLINTQGV